MKKSLSAILLLATCLSYGQKLTLGKENLLATFKINPKTIEQKAFDGSDYDLSEQPQPIRSISREFGSMVRDMVSMPYSIASAIREPSAFGLDYNTFEVSYTINESLLSEIFIAEIVDYELFKQKITALDEREELLFKSKRGWVTIYENSVFTDKKKLVVVKTSAAPIKNQEYLWVERKEDAERTKSFYGTEMEHELELKKPMEVRPYGKKSSESYETTEVEYAVEEAAEEVEEEAYLGTEEPYEEKNYYYDIKYIYEHKIIDNKAVALPFLKGVKYGAIKSLNAYVNSTADIALWVNNERLMALGKQVLTNEIGKGFGMLELTGLTTIPTLYANSYTLGEMSFDKGETQLKLTSYVNKELYDITKKMSNTRIDDKMLAYLPASSPAYSGFAVDYTQVFAQYENILKQIAPELPQMDTIVLESWELLKMVIDEDALAKMFSGQGLVFVDGANEFTKEYRDYYYDEEYNYVSRDTVKTVNRPSFFVLMGTDDLTSWQRIANIMEQTGIVTKRGNVYSFNDGTRYNSYRKPKEVGFYMTLNNGMISMSNDSEKLKAMSKDGGKVNAGIKEKFSNSSSLMYIDGVKLKTYLDANKFDIPPVFGTVIEDYQSIEVSGLVFNGDSYTSTASIKSIDTSINILKQFIKTIDKVNK